ncbi:MAG: hypothetical protein HYW48_04885 [Deltaproteobacteria bacterium]|nr:hypothetical protein [Deltaproteobacteria bacterium]
MKRKLCSLILFGSLILSQLVNASPISSAVKKFIVPTVPIVLAVLVPHNSGLASEYSKFLMRAGVLTAHAELKNSGEIGNYPGAAASLILFYPAHDALQLVGHEHVVDAQNFQTFALITAAQTFSGWVGGMNPSAHTLTAALSNGALLAGYRLANFDTGGQTLHSKALTAATMPTTMLFLNVGKQAAQTLGVSPSLVPVVFITLGAQQFSTLSVGASHLRRNLASTLVQTGVVAILSGEAQAFVQNAVGKEKAPLVVGLSSVMLGTLLYFVTPRSGYPVVMHLATNARYAAFMVGFMALTSAFSNLL